MHIIQIIVDSNMHCNVHLHNIGDRAIQREPACVTEEHTYKDVNSDIPNTCELHWLIELVIYRQVVRFLCLNGMQQWDERLLGIVH